MFSPSVKCAKIKLCGGKFSKCIVGIIKIKQQRSLDADISYFLARKGIEQNSKDKETGLGV